MIPVPVGSPVGSLPAGSASQSSSLAFGAAGSNTYQTDFTPPPASQDVLAVKFGKKKKDKKPANKLVTDTGKVSEGFGKTRSRLIDAQNLTNNLSQSANFATAPADIKAGIDSLKLYLAEAVTAADGIKETVEGSPKLAEKTKKQLKKAGKGLQGKEHELGFIQSIITLPIRMVVGIASWFNSGKKIIMNKALTMGKIK